MRRDSYREEANYFTNPDNISDNDYSTLLIVPKAFEHLKLYKEMDVIFMFNFDSDYNGQFEIYNTVCSFSKSIKWVSELNEAVNLLSYYFLNIHTKN